MIFRKTRAAARTLALLLSSLGIVTADTPTGTLTGTVTDSSGRILVHAKVTARSADTGVLRATTTNEVGVYQVLGLHTGTYKVSASLEQFTAMEQSDVQLRVGETVRISFTLPIGSSREAIEVTGSGPMVSAESASSSTVVNRESIADLPSDGRQLQNLALIVPGVSAGWNVSTAANRYGKARENTEGAFNVNGARSRSNNFLLDGNPLVVQQYSVINFEPSNEAVQEFSVIASVPSAEYGRTMGGQVSVVTKSGTSNFHGSVYEFFRNNVLNANDTLSKRAGLSRGTVRHNQFGGTLGGPIWKQKHFFFTNVEVLRNLEASESRTVSVPTANQARGLVDYTDSNGQRRTLDLSNRITPLSRKLLALYPSPNTGLAQGNYTTQLPIQLNDYQYHVRTDHHFSERDIVTFRVSWSLNDQTYIIDRFGGPYIPGFTLPNPERTTNGTVGYLHTFSSNVVNEARLGVNRYGNTLANGDQRNAAEFGLPNGSSANGIPSIVFAQGGLTGLGGLSWYNRDQNETTVFASNSLSVLRRKHSLKFGVSANRYHFNTRGAGNQRGSIFFDGSQNKLIPNISANTNANAIADLLLGLPFQATITVGQFGRGYRQWGAAGYVQDSYRLRRNLTLDLGLRYDLVPSWTEVNGKLSNFQPNAGVVAGLDRLYEPSHKNFAPRLGFAYDVSGKQTTVLRGGFGMFYETLLQASTVQQVENNPPYSAAAITTTPTPFAKDDATSTTLLDLRSNAKSSRSLSAVSRNLRTPYSMQYFFEIQHAFAGSWLATAGYHGTRGVHLPFNYDLNQAPLDLLTATQRTQIAASAATPAGTAGIVDSLRPYPNFNSISLFTNEATSSYHGLQLKAERRFKGGLNLLAGYTWSKTIDNASDFASGDASERVLNSRRVDLQKALSSFDVPHRFTAAFNFVVPAPRFKAVLGGWQFNGVVTAQSGQPFTPFTSQFDPFRNESFNRLNLVSDPNRNIPAGLAYNPSAFVLPPVGTFGNSGRNIVRGAGYSTSDLSVFRNLVVSESFRLQIRAEASNAFNQVNFQGPVTNQSTTPGAFVATAPARVVQLGLKMTF